MHMAAIPHNKSHREHPLCEYCNKCATEQFMGAFRTEIDYIAHMSSVHGKLMNKQQAKQNRTLQLEITLGPRGRNGQTEQNIAQMRTREDDVAEELMNEEMQTKKLFYDDSAPSYKHIFPMG